MRFSGIDSDANWVASARKESKANHFRFLFADVGDTGPWGMPENKQLAKIPYDYCGKEASKLSSFQHMPIHQKDSLIL